MINTFQVIGRTILEKDGYYDTEDIIEKRKKLLFYQSIVPFEKKDKKGNKILDGRAICLNFDIEKNEIEFRLSEKELTEENREYFFAFKLGAPKDKKKFLSTNNISTILSFTFLGAFEYLQEKRENRNSKKWINHNISMDYQDFLYKVYKHFYSNNGKEVFLNNDLLCAEQKYVFNEIKEQFPNKKILELYTRFINRYYSNTDSKDISFIPSISMVLFNNERIIDFKESKYRNDYINMCYYDLLKRFIIEKGKENKLCHICKQEKTVVQDLPLSMKFYGTTNTLNFEQLSGKNAYKSFAVCNDCLPEILTGMKYIQNNFSEYIFDLNYYLIPTSIEDNNLDLKLYKGVNKILKINKSIYKNEIVQIKELLRRANRKEITFDMMFYHHPAGSQQFDVLKLISNIELNDLLPKMELLDLMSEQYILNSIGDGGNALTVNNLRYYLFPSYLTHKNPEYNVFAKDLLNFLESFLTNQKISYQLLLKKFVAIYKKRINNNKVDILSAFKMNLFISVLNKLNLLKGGYSVNDGQFVSEILKNEYQEFFNTHSDVYSQNAYRQGLFLLGTVISKIIYVQKEKSSNFLKKLNFDGMPVRRIPVLINHVKEFEEIYRKKIFQEKGIWGNIMDRLQGIESSGLKPDEVVFYILSGISFEDYLGMKRALDKKRNELNNQGEEK